MTTRPRQISLLHMILHFSWTVGPPQTGQMMAGESAAAESPMLAASSESDVGIPAVKISGWATAGASTMRR